MRVYDVASGKLVNELKGHEGRVRGLTWLADGKTLVSRAEDTTLRFWDTTSGQLTRRVAGRAGLWNFLPERGLLQTGSFSYAVRFRDITSNRPQATLVLLRQGRTALGLVVTPQGHYRASPRLEPEIVYVVRSERGQQVLSPDEFAAKYEFVGGRQPARPGHRPRCSRSRSLAASWSDMSCEIESTL